MKISKVEAMVLRAPVAGIETWRAASFAVPFKYAKTTLVRLETDTGLVGWGEAHAPVTPEVSKAVVDTLLAPAILGRDPQDYGVLWDEMYALMRPRGHALGFTLEAISGVDIALVDLAAQAADVPVYTLMGGAHRERVRTYASVLQWVAPPELATLALAHVEKGFTALKLKVGQDPLIDAEKARAVREAVGPGVDLMADANCRFTASEAVRMARILEAQDFTWLEEPVPPEDIEGYRAVRAKVDIAIAGGECECTHHRFAHLLALGTFDVIQPDICRAGGLTACHRIGVLADAHNVRIAPHVSIGSAIHIAASLHWALSAKPVFIHEFPIFENPLVDDLFETPLDWRAGYLHTPTGSGLGITVREDVVTRYRVA